MPRAPIKMQLNVNAKDEVTGCCSHKKAGTPIHLESRLTDQQVTLTTVSGLEIKELFIGAFDV